MALAWLSTLVAMAVLVVSGFVAMSDLFSPLIRWLGAGACLASAVFLFASVYAGSSRPADVRNALRETANAGKRLFEPPSYRAAIRDKEGLEVRRLV